jgi:hypothetical protein
MYEEVVQKRNLSVQLKTDSENFGGRDRKSSIQYEIVPATDYSTKLIPLIVIVVRKIPGEKFTG